MAVRLENKAYDRNKFHFCFGFVLSKETEVYPYEAILRKFTKAIKGVEVESGFLFNADDTTVRGKLEYIYNNLSTEDGECQLKIDDSNRINLKLFRRLALPPVVEDWHVPVRIRNFAKVMDPRWDLTLTIMAPHIDGINYVSKIAKIVDGDTEVVKQCISQLLYYKCVTLIDIFQYSNRYECTPDIRKLSVNTQMQDDCIDYLFPVVIPTPTDQPPAPQRLGTLPLLPADQWMRSVDGESHIAYRSAANIPPKRDVYPHQAALSHHPTALQSPLVASRQVAARKSVSGAPTHHLDGLSTLWMTYSGSTVICDAINRFSTLSKRTV